MSPEKEAMAVGAIYRGDAQDLLHEDTPLRQAYYGTDDEKFDVALQNHYKEKGVAPRSVNHDKFWKQQTERRQAGQVQSVKQAIDAVKRQQETVSQWGQNWQNRLSEGGSLNQEPTWDNLSMKEKSAYIRTAVLNGMTRLQDIRQAYNEFAKGGFMPSKEMQ